RRRHTRSKRDWSSDVCSSDLAFHPRQDVDQRQLHLMQQPGGPAAVQVGVERRGELGGGLRLPHQGGRRGYRGLLVGLLAFEVERELAAGLLTAASQLLAQVAQGQVGEVEGAL